MSERRGKIKTVFIDSRTRVLGASGSSASNFTVVFDRNYDNVTEVRLQSATIPIINTDLDAHGVSSPAYQPNTYVMLHVKPLGGNGGSYGSTLSAAFGDPSNAVSPGDNPTRNYIADGDSIVAIPLLPNGPNISLGGGVVVNFTHWEHSENHEAALLFTPPITTLKGLELALYVWGNGATQSRTAFNQYPLPSETVPASATDASSLKPINNVQYQFEILHNPKHHQILFFAFFFFSEHTSYCCFWS